MIDQQAVLAVIRAALDGIPAEGAGISIDEYLSFARKQQIEALFIYGLMKSKIPLPKEVRNVYIRAAMASSRQVKAGQALFAAFRKHGIDYLPLKGSKLKFLYPDEAIRSMGDIDVLVRVSQYDAIRAVMLSLGYTEQTQSDHEYIWRGSEALVELHKRLIPSYNKDYYAYFGEGWSWRKRAAPLTNTKWPRRTPSFISLPTMQSTIATPAWASGRCWTFTSSGRLTRR